MATTKANVKLVVYDFDLTISSQHLYNILGGGRLDELSKLSDDELSVIFGGKDRITRLNTHLSRVVSIAHIAVLSHGYTDVIRKALDRMQLFHHFKDAQIIGSDSQELESVHFNKAKVIQNMRKQFNLSSNQVLFVDDDSQNIRNAAGTCQTLEVTLRKGMNDEHMEKIEILVGVRNDNNNQDNSDDNEDDVNNVNDIDDNKLQLDDSKDNLSCNGRFFNNNKDIANRFSGLSLNNDSIKNSQCPCNKNTKSWRDKYSLNIPSWFEEKLNQNWQQDIITTPVIDIGDSETPNTSDSEDKFVLSAPDLTSIKD